MKQACKKLKRNCLRTWLVTALLIHLAIPSVMGATQSTDQPERTTVSGIVTGQMKYSIQIQSGETVLEIATGPRTEYRQRIVRPEFDLDKKRISCEVAASGTKATDNVNLSVEIAIQTPLYIRGWFRHEQEMTRCWESGGQRRLVNYILTATAPETFWLPDPKRLDLAGAIESIDSRSVATIRFGDLSIQALLLDRDASVDHGSFLDLEPFVTEVQATIRQDGDLLIADEIIFTRLLDPLAGEVAGLPRCLVLGDEMSLSTLGPLRNNHADIANFSHPPENCRGGENRERLPVWLGPYKSPGHHWDVILFNFGQANLQSTDEEYATMLREWVELLRPTGAKLVWVQTVPRTPSRSIADLDQMQRLNKLAIRFFDAYPEITICDPARDTTPEEMKRMEPPFWWARCARLIAGTVEEVLKRNNSGQ